MGNFFDDLGKGIGDLGKGIGDIANNVTKEAGKVIDNSGKALSDMTQQAGKVVGDVVSEAGKVVGETVDAATKIVEDTGNQIGRMTGDLLGGSQPAISDKDQCSKEKEIQEELEGQNVDILEVDKSDWPIDLITLEKDVDENDDSKYKRRFSFSSLSNISFLAFFYLITFRFENFLSLFQYYFWMKKHPISKNYTGETVATILKKMGNDVFDRSGSQLPYGRMKWFLLSNEKYANFIDETDLEYYG